ncbi:MAG TPA: glycosyltransferase family 4 protein [Acidimicrobiales bacterium]|nr:glycosyltransferase family 4 protein [Acidimicrobiales bacterium]
MNADAERLRVAYLVYRGNPRCGGQGVYTRHLTSELTKLGHEVTVFSGQPYPELEDGVGFVPVASLDLYREPDPFRVPRISEFKSSIDALEFAIMCTAGFPEPRTFTLRARKLLAARAGDFDVVHDNQSLGSGLLGIMADGWPLLGTIHHPITVDRELDLSHATTIRRRLTLRRWYGFIDMQRRVARQIPRVVTVSESSCHDIAAQFGVERSRMAVVPVGVDEKVFRPRPEIARVPGRLVTTASADVPMKGLVPLLEALAKVRTERADAHLVVVGKLREGSVVPGVLDRLSLDGAVGFLSGISDDQLSELYASAEVAVVPSLYEGFSLPAIEAMASGVTLVATTGGALPEVAGTDGETALLVEPNDAGALAAGLLRALDDADLRARIGAAGRKRTLERFTWPVTARLTAEQYRVLLEERAREREAVPGPTRRYAPGEIGTSAATTPGPPC